MVLVKIRYLRGRITVRAKGQRDWVDKGTLLKQHENGSDHCYNVAKWKEFSLCLPRKTIDATEMALLEAEKIVRDVLIRLISTIQFLEEKSCLQGVCIHIP